MAWPTRDKINDIQAALDAGTYSTAVSRDAPCAFHPANRACVALELRVGGLTAFADMPGEDYDKLLQEEANAQLLSDAREAARFVLAGWHAQLGAE